MELSESGAAYFCATCGLGNYHTCGSGTDNKGDCSTLHEALKLEVIKPI
jgi:hypothetical protein